MNATSAVPVRRMSERFRRLAVTRLGLGSVGTSCPLDPGRACPRLTLDDQFRHKKRGRPHHYCMTRAAPIQGGLVKSLVLLLIATLVARLTKQLAVLLFRHTLAALLNNGTHGTYLGCWKCLRACDHTRASRTRWTRQTDLSLPRRRSGRHFQPRIRPVAPPVP